MDNITNPSMATGPWAVAAVMPERIGVAPSASLQGTGVPFGGYLGSATTGSPLNGTANPATQAAAPTTHGTTLVARKDDRVPPPRGRQR